MTLLDRIKNLPLNIFQSLALVGIAASLACQVGLYFMNKQVDRFWAVYVIWLTVLILSTVIKVDADHDHHHEH